MNVGIVDRLLLDQKSIIAAMANGLEYRPPTGYLKEYLLKKGAEVTVAETIVRLTEDSRSLSSYDVFLIHPGIDKQRKTIQRIRDEAPNSLLAIITFNVEDYISERGVSVFSLDSEMYDVMYCFLEEHMKRKRSLMMHHQR